MNGKTGVRLLLIGTTIDITTKASRTSRRRVYRGEHLQLHRVRQRALDQFWKQHPERFVRGRPRALSLPDQVWINRPQSTEQEPSKNQKEIRDFIKKVSQRY